LFCRKDLAVKGILKPSFIDFFSDLLNIREYGLPLREWHRGSQEGQKIYGSQQISGRYPFRAYVLSSLDFDRPEPDWCDRTFAGEFQWRSFGRRRQTADGYGGGDIHFL
jgi:hypothetical protein